ncbi:GGDEF domain-containing protein [Desulfonema ishimotonii]|uniref:GGDEF domain-containing protein n=1 Tax=Desulfonema ishimotonii TaxID=45657 RepID=A0A401G1N2_9BACT|nr:bifunctional diguanylate cyclase/phosphodiesterase [Desulfonema ishimotonii]GBC63130.1 GGDEF domain-containing protein [Desulfonema ishimotonii]
MKTNIPTYDELAQKVRDLERRLARTKKEMASEKRHVILESIGEGYYEMSLKGHFKVVNSALARMLGFSKAQLLGMNSAEFVDARTARSAFRLFHQIYKKGSSLKGAQWAFTRKDGSTCFIETSAYPISDEQGETVGFRGIVQDISVSKRTEMALKVQTAYAEAFINIAPEAIVILDTEDRVIRINHEFTKLFGYTPEEAVGEHLNNLIIPDALKDKANALNHRLKCGKRVETETLRQSKGGQLIDVSVLAAPVRLDDERLGIYAIYRDITKRKKAEKALKESEERHRIVLEAAPDPIVVFDMVRQVIYVNPAFTRVFGWTPSECIGRKIDFVAEEDQKALQDICHIVSGGESFSGIETWRLTKSGTRVDVSISGACFFDSNSAPIGCILTFQDISERKKAQEEICFIAYHDTLTGLKNRKAFYMCLEKKLNGGGRRARDHDRWALLFMDLDRFKYVNDSLGHDAGDELLKEVARRLRECLRTSDHIFRLGGDEFTVILESLHRDTDVTRVVRKIRNAVSGPLDVKGHKLYVSVSIGISLFPADGTDVEVLVKNADMAMYSAKESGEGYRFFTEEMNLRAVERMELENSLRNAVQNDELVVYYQPLVDSRSRILGMEALLRWQHPALGLVKPSVFIPLAEETGLIVPIGEWVLQTACLHTKKLQALHHRSLHVAVNLSARQFREPDLVACVEKALRISGLAPECLKLEVTESSIMENPEEAIVKMTALQEKGVRFSIDDFGTGYSSLSYLRRFPIDTLKIDRSFVSESLANQDDQEIIRTIIMMAKNLNIETIAEGVENRAQQEFLNCQGCRIMQGYYFGRPMTYDDFRDILKYNLE